MYNNNTGINSNNEITFLGLFKIAWSKKKIIIRIIIIFGIIGLFIAVFSEKEYIASTTVIPQTSKNKISSNLGGLAAIAGINIGGGSDRGIPPSLYPKIVQSIPFKKELLKTALNFTKIKGKITYKEYYENHKSENVFSILKSYTIGLPGKMVSLFKTKSNKITDKSFENDSIYRVSSEENNLFNQLQGQLLVEVNKKEGFIKISFSMPEALCSAQMTKKVKELLQQAIINFKIQKSKDEYKFIQERYDELKKDFKKKQSTLASFRDRNQGLATSRSKSYLESLESDYNLAYNVYSELAKQLETQKIKLKENTPIFTVIEPVSVPMKKAKPKRMIIVFVWGFLGVVFAMGYVFVKEWVNSINLEGK